MLHFVKKNSIAPAPVTAKIKGNNLISGWEGGKAAVRNFES